MLYGINITAVGLNDNAVLSEIPPCIVWVSISTSLLSIDDVEIKKSYYHTN